MTANIKNDNGHYELEIDGQFYGSYDTFTDAVDDLEEAIESQNKNA